MHNNLIEPQHVYVLYVYIVTSYNDVCCGARRAFVKARRPLFPRHGTGQQQTTIDVEVGISKMNLHKAPSPDEMFQRSFLQVCFKIFVSTNNAEKVFCAFSIVLVEQIYVNVKAVVRQSDLLFSFLTHKRYLKQCSPMPLTNTNKTTIKRADPFIFLELCANWSVRKEKVVSVADPGQFEKQSANFRLPMLST